MRLCLFSCVLLLSVSSFAGATVIDFSNLGTLSSTKTVTVDDVTINLQSSGGVLTSTTTTFGVDGSGANDAINLLDGGNGTAESVLFLFNHDVIIDSITLSQFNGADAGTLNIKALGNFPLGPGTTTIGQIAEGGSAHRISMPDRSRQATPTGLALTA